MEDRRLGCYYCFSTLDPQDKLASHRTFAKCKHCNAIFHEVCLRHSKKCLCCGSNQGKLIKIKSPPSLQAITKTQMLPVKARVLAYSIAGKEFVIPEFAYKHILPVLSPACRWTLSFVRKIIYEYVIPAYFKHVLPVIQKIRNRI